jgi:uncharacterized repeat protein (TIGR04076 family)
MSKPKITNFPGHEVIATVKKVRGECSWGHEVGDTFAINCHDTAGLCGFFYHDLFPYITMLQFTGSFPKEWVDDPDVVTLGCMDKANQVTIELRRKK